MGTGKSYYITTPIYYVNDKPHLGHAYTTIACDVLARFKRLDGYDVFFLTGTDEHGQKVAEAAAKAGIDPQKFTDQVSQNFRDLMPILNFSNNDFIRTTEARHKKASQAIWERMTAAGDIYKDKYGGWYAVRDEAYYGEDELKTVNGKKIAPSGAECEWVEEESYFFRLSKWGDKLLDFYAKHPDFILPESRRNEVISFVKGGLKDLSVSRSRLKWGVPVPGDDKHVMYVWVDALTNYLTAIGYPDENSASFKKYWPADLHMVGKDILRFHAVYWPAFLMSAGIAPPKRIFAHGWWTIEGQKMSKSLGNVIAPADLIARYGVDQSRYFLLREVPFGNDGDFSHERAVHMINNDLANGLGNLAQRTLSMIQKNCDGKVPNTGAPEAPDKELLDSARGLIGKLRKELDVQNFSGGIEEIHRVVMAANAYIDHQAPWKLKKENPARMETVLYTLAETIRCLGIVVLPFMPASAEKILDQVAAPANHRDFSVLDAAHALKSGTLLPAPQGVFPRIVDEKAAE
ncbi:MAG TPA: methionine--tRNA ligase [Patescibacteria group bacterium]|nr:methionine--tRNA ligase [Patescibacteria group bacterium]